VPVPADAAALPVDTAHSPSPPGGAADDRAQRQPHGGRRALDITQPAVSQWLADIESAAGARLFERGRRLRPTPFAAPLLAHAERVLQDAQRALGEVQAIRSRRQRAACASAPCRWPRPRWCRRR
jgi:DNA-binding transcriptional LysR family regulator